MLEEKIVLREAATRGITVSDEDVRPRCVEDANQQVCHRTTGDRDSRGRQQQPPMQLARDTAQLRQNRLSGTISGSKHHTDNCGTTATSLTDTVASAVVSLQQGYEANRYLRGPAPLTDAVRLLLVNHRPQQHQSQFNTSDHTKRSTRKARQHWKQI